MKALGWLILLFVIMSVAWCGYISTQIDIKESGLQTTQKVKYIAIKESNVPMSDYPKVMQGAFMKLEDFHRENNQIKLGKPFSSYKKTENSDNYDLIMGYELLNQPMFNDKEIIKGVRPSIQAFAYEMTGEYKYLMYAWFYAIFKTDLLGDYQIDKSSISYELYDVSYADKVEAKDFKTIIYIPVIAKNI